MSARRWMLHGLTAVTLTSLFLYPLAAAIDSQIFFLHWRPRHSWELAIAFALLTSAAVMAVATLDRVRSDRAGLCGLMAVALVPLMSLAVGLLRALPLKDSLAPLADLWWVRSGVAIAMALGVGATLAFVPGLARAALRGLLLVLSPISVVVLLALVQVVRYPGIVELFERSGGGSTGTATRSHVLILLFDELSFRWLYDQRKVRAVYPHLRAFAARATHYHAASAPGAETLISLPGYLLGRRLYDTDVAGDALLEVKPDGSRVPLDMDTESNLFAAARESGLRPEMVGWYYPYCRMLAASLDRCEAFSLYNAASVFQRLSPLNPIRTTLILWPHQFPSGLLKNPVFAVHQRELTARIEAAATSPWPADQPALRFVHFNIPHVPFVFDRDGYNPPFEPVSNRADLYERQLAYVDTVFGRLMRSLDERGIAQRTTVVVLSDHEFRGQTPRDEWAHVPLIIRHAGQTAREDVNETVQAEIVLRSLAARPFSRPASRPGAARRIVASGLQ